MVLLGAILQELREMNGHLKKRGYPADVIGTASMVAKIATGELVEDDGTREGKDKPGGRAGPSRWHRPSRQRGIWPSVAKNIVLNCVFTPLK